MFWRDLDGRVPVINSGNYDMTMMNDVEVCGCFPFILAQDFSFIISQRTQQHTQCF